MVKDYLVFIAVCVAIVVICYCCWFSPLFMLFGGLSALIGVICLIRYIVTKSKPQDDFDVTIALSSNLGVFLLIVALFMNEDCYISEYNDQRHIYQDCNEMRGDHCYEVCKFSAIIWGCFSDCQKCSLRHEEEMNKKRDEWRRKQKEEDLHFIDQQIEELVSVRKKILEGKSVNAEDYEFVGGFSPEDEYDEYFEGVPSRYQ